MRKSPLTEGYSGVSQEKETKIILDLIINNFLGDLVKMKHKTVFFHKLFDKIRILYNFIGFIGNLGKFELTLH